MSRRQRVAVVVDPEFVWEKILVTFSHTPHLRNCSLELRRPINLRDGDGGREYGGGSEERDDERVSIPQVACVPRQW